MSKLKKLIAKHEKYVISLEHRFVGDIPEIKATIAIPGENNTFTKRVSTNFISGESVQDAEKKAVDSAVDLLLGNKLTQKLNQFPIFDLQLVPFSGAKSAPVGVKVILNVSKDDGKLFRNTVSLATGTEISEVESLALKNAINSVLGV